MSKYDNIDSGVIAGAVVLGVALWFGVAGVLALAAQTVANEGFDQSFKYWPVFWAMVVFRLTLNLTGTYKSK